MRKISCMKIIVSLVLFLEKLLPDKVYKKMIESGIDFYIKKYVNIKIINKERLDSINEPVIFIGNHLSNSDGLILNKVLKEKDVTFIMGVKLTQDAMTNIGCKIVKTIQINPSSPDRNAISNLIQHIKNGNNAFIFPEGTRSRNSTMLKAKRGIYLIAKLCNVPIVPIAIYGSEKFMPIDKKGEMNNETFNRADVCVSIGNKITLPVKKEGEDKKVYEERCIEYFMRGISEMLPEEYRGVYS